MLCFRTLLLQAANCCTGALLRFRFPEPDGVALVKLAVMHMASREFYRKAGWGEKHW